MEDVVDLATSVDCGRLDTISVDLDLRCNIVEPTYSSKQHFNCPICLCHTAIGEVVSRTDQRYWHLDQGVSIKKKSCLYGDFSRQPMTQSGSLGFSHDKGEGPNHPGATWYLSRREIEENSPSRSGGIDLKKETYLRKSYCTFLQDLGMKLKVPQVTIATAIIFCHRFFLRQSHAKNDRRTIATVCMFLAGKVEETPRPLKDVILVSYEIIHKRDPAAVQRIKQKEVYEQQKELILLGEKVVLATLGFDLNVHHPYKPLVEAIKKFQVAQNALAKVAWNFVNDGLRTSLCLQFKPHHIAAGAIFLAAKFLKVKLPSDGEKVWWKEFDVTPRQLEEVSNQMLELYEQSRATSSHGTETEGNSTGPSNSRALPKTHPNAEESSAQSGNSHGTTRNSNMAISTLSATDSHADLTGTHMSQQNEGNNHNAGWSHNADYGKDHHHHEAGSVADNLNYRTSHASERHLEDLPMSEKGGKGERKESNSGHGDAPKGYSPIVAINKDKVKAALEKRRKSQSNISRKIDIMDEDDMIERELENGVELAAEDVKTKQEKNLSWSKPLYGHDPAHGSEDKRNGNNSFGETAEEGELSFDGCEFQSPDHGKRKRKNTSPTKKNEGPLDVF